MNCSRDDEERNRDLWRRFADAAGKAAAEDDLDPNVLAAYLDGAAGPEEAEAVERAMAADASLVDAVVELREALADGRAEVPEPVRARLRAALSTEAGRARGRHATWAPPIGMPWYVGIAVAAAVLIASLLGFEMGRYGVGPGVDRTDAIRRELAPELGRPSVESGLLVAFGRAGDLNGGAR